MSQLNNSRLFAFCFKVSSLINLLKFQMQLKQTLIDFGSLIWWKKSWNLQGIVYISMAFVHFNQSWLYSIEFIPIGVWFWTNTCNSLHNLSKWIDPSNQIELNWIELNWIGFVMQTHKHTLIKSNQIKYLTSKPPFG